MANRDHLAKLEEGVAAWNQWREANPSIKPDLYRAYFNGANLSGVDFSEADLPEAVLLNLTMTGASLVRANLSKAVLKQAKVNKSSLWKANLRGANLSGADFCDAILHGADLREADLDASDLRAVLTGANLSRANLSLATLTKAVLTKSKLRRTILRKADLTHANLIDATMKKATLVEANLSKANLSRADLYEADLRGAKLIGATLIGANLGNTNLTGANLSHANLYGANLSGAILQSADLTAARLTRTTLVRTSCENTVFSGCHVYGMSVWDVNLTGAVQSNLVITPKDQPQIRVDNLQVAQFIYLLLNRQELRNVITTLGERAVLILGRFTERKDLLDRIADKLRSLGYLPMIFDFERPTDRDITETVKILAGLSRFVIADITNPRSVPLELQAVVPDYMVPFVTILQRGQPAFGLFDDLPGKYHWALPLLEYNSGDTLLAAFEQKVVNPALDKAQEVRIQKAAAPVRRSAED